MNEIIIKRIELLESQLDLIMKYLEEHDKLFAEDKIAISGICDAIRTLAEVNKAFIP